MWTEMESPVGTLRIVAADERLRAIDFAPFTDTDATDPGAREDGHPLLVKAVRQLEAYFAGERTDFELPLAPVGTDFQQQVWRALQQIPHGTTESYGGLAQRIGRTAAASRAVGMANGRNPLPIVIPCHRVIGAKGALVGYSGGMDRKLRLLELERRVGAPASTTKAAPAQQRLSA